MRIREKVWEVGPVIRRRRLATVLFAAWLIGPQGAAAGDAPPQANAPLAAALETLTHAPDDVDLLTKAADAALAAERKDDALWLLQRAIATTRRGNTADERLPGLEKRRDALDPLSPEQRNAEADFAATLRNIGRVAVERAHYVNAVQILARLEGSAEADRADALLDRVFRDKKAVRSLLDSSVPVPATTTFQRIRAKSAKEEAKHAAWKDAWEVKSKNYIVRCNDGWETTSRVATAMERINGLYRDVFRYANKRLGARTKTCEVRLYASRDEYVKAGALEGALAYYSPSETAVVAYDPRSDGSPLSSLWGTLFHEASHQFTDLISPGLVPAWLNEGTASYFEGTLLRADGGIETNLVPMERLTNLVDTLRERSPTLRDVISFHEPGSYPAEYYCVGWGLVYFLRNYEDEAGNRVYVAPYDAYMDSYRVDSPTPSSYDRFVEYIVTGPKQEGIETFEDFERRFSNWILDLNDLHSGPPDRARAFVLQGRRRLEQGHPDRAEESFRNALRKAPDDVAALLELSQLAAASDRHDEAIARLREILEQVARHGDAATGMPEVPFDSAAELAAEATHRVEALDESFATALARLDTGFGEGALARAETYRAAGFPRNAVRVLHEASTLLDGHVEIDREAQRIADESDLRVLLWRALPVPDDLAGWWHTRAWKAENGVVSGSAVACARAVLYEGELPARYRFEATVTRVDGGEDAYVGIVYGVDPDAAWDVAGVAGDGLEIDRRFNTWTYVAAPRGLTEDQMRECRIAVEVRPGHARFFLDGEFCGEQDYAPGELRGGIGLIVSDAAARFGSLRVAW